MIISHKYKFIFFAIPKTGTHSIRFALRPHLGSEDEEHVGLYHHSRLNIDAFKDRINGHMSVKEIRPYISDEIWNTYYKFCFVRNPWDRFVSAVFFKNKEIQENEKYAAALMKYTIEEASTTKGMFYRPQTGYLTNDEEQLAMDFIGKTETIQADYNKICKYLGIPSQQLEQVNTSKHKDYSRYYDTELKEKVANFYQQDIENFNYQF
jgi:hypothetical protein